MASMTRQNNILAQILCFLVWLGVGVFALLFWLAGWELWKIWRAL